MEQAEFEAYINNLKRRPIKLDQKTKIKLQYGKDDVNRILPHRPPFDFVESIEALDSENSAIEASGFVDANNPIFKGHFPDYPIYPGVHQIETMGQAGLCLAYFVKNGTTAINNESSPVQCMFTKVHHASFLRPVLPGSNLNLRAQILEHDDFVGIVAAQIIVDDKINSFSILEVCFT